MKPQNPQKIFQSRIANIKIDIARAVLKRKIYVFSAYNKDVKI